MHTATNSLALHYALTRMFAMRGNVNEALSSGKPKPIFSNVAHCTLHTYTGPLALFSQSSRSAIAHNIFLCHRYTTKTAHTTNKAHTTHSCRPSTSPAAGTPCLIREPPPVKYWNPLFSYPGTPFLLTVCLLSAGPADPPPDSEKG